MHVWLLHDPQPTGYSIMLSSQDSQTYCLASCSKEHGLTPNLIDRTCQAAFGLNSCSQGQYNDSMDGGCLQCDAICLSCSYTGACDSCVSGYYMDLQVQQCVAKQDSVQPTLRVFVAKGEYTGTPNDADGTAQNPFFDIRDALAYINQNTAKYVTREAILYLQKGTHYITLRDGTMSEYQMSKSADYTQNEYSLTIIPLYCSDTDAGVTDTARCHQDGQKVTVKNKIGSYFFFDVPFSLSISYVIFDAIDSIANFTTPCIGIRADTCAFDSDTLQVTSNIDECCTAPSQHLDTCNFAHPTSFIRMRYTRGNQLQTPKTLELSHTQFRHFFYEMNSLIQYPKEGGFVTINNSIFEYFSTCGSVISNLYIIPYDEGQRLFQNTGGMGGGAVADTFAGQVSQFQYKHGNPISIQEVEFAYDNTNGTYMNPYKSSSICYSQAQFHDCYSINVQSSTFQHFDIFFSTEPFSNNLLQSNAQQRPRIEYKGWTPAQTEQLYDEYRAPIFLLTRYLGRLTVQSSTFKEIRYPVRTCYEHSYENNIDKNNIAPYLLYTSIEGVKQEMPIIITEAYRMITFSGNTVSYASGSKGFMFISRARLATEPSIIHGNTFSHVSGFGYSGVLNLRSNYTGVSRWISSDFCAGFHVASNTFQNSVVCPVPNSHPYYKQAGLIKVSCSVDQTSLKTDEIYVDPNSWWNIESALDLSPSMASITVGSTTFEVDTKMTTIKDNKFLSNLRGIRSSIILALQMPYLRMSNNIYTENGDVILQKLITSYNLTQFYGGFVGTTYSMAPESYSNYNTGALVQILGGFGFSAIGDTIGQGNWKQDILNQVYSSYIYAGKVRGEITIANMTITTPPLSGCSNVVEPLIQIPYTYYAYCGGYGSYPAQTREPLIKIQNYNDASFWFPSGVTYQTIFNFQHLHISNLYNGLTTQAFLSAPESTALTQIKVAAANVTLNSLMQSDSSIIDLRGLNAQISGLYLTDIGNSTVHPAYAIRLGDNSNSNNDLSFTLSDLTMTRVYTDQSLFNIPDGGASLTLTASLSSISITDCQVKQYILYLMNSDVSATLDGWIVQNTSIVSKTTPNNYEFSVTQSNYFSMNNITHSCDVSRTHCKVLRFYQNTRSLSITNSNFKMVENTAGYQLDQSDKNPPFSIFASSMSMSSNSFSGYTSLNTQGGVFKIQTSSFIDSNSNYYLNTGASTGGVFYFEGAGGTLTITSSNFYSNSATNAGVIQLVETVRLNADGCHFYKNTATSSGGVLRTQQGATFYIKNSQFYQNTAGTDSSVIYSFSNEASQSSKIETSFIYNNRMPTGKNTMIVLYSTLELDTVQFYENLSLEGSHGIYTAYSLLTIANSKCYTKDMETFSFTFKSSETTNAVDSTSVCLTVSEDATVTLRNSTFANGRDNSGSIALQGIVQITIQNCTFTDNFAASGAAIYASNFYDLTINECVFQSNGAWDAGADIYIENSNRGLTISSSNFTSAVINSVYVADAELILSGSIFTSQQYQQFFNQDQQYAVICDNCGELSAQNNKFINIEVDGAIHAKNTSLRYAEDQSISTKVYIEGNTFQNIQYHTNGGAVKINNFDAVLIQNNVFKNIQQHTADVELKGAAIYQTGSFSINVRIAQNTFQSNQATVGGAIAYEFYRPQIENSNTFTNNAVRSYGTDIAGYATQLAFISEETARQLIPYDFSQTYTDHSVSSITLYSDFKITTHQSGGTAANFYIAILDRFGQIVSTQNDDKLTVGLKVITASNYAPVATTALDIRSNNGVFNVTGLTLIAEPDTTVTIEITADAVFTSTLPDVIDFQASNGGNLILSSTVQFRACIEGEAFLDNGECSPCNSETSYLLTLATTPTNCQNCPNNANCFGGKEIGPKAGYWRSSSVSVNFMTCFLAAACQGRQSVNDDPLGNCADGYRGMFCAQCISGYTRSSNFSCAKCPEQWKNILLLVGVFLIALILIVLLVKSTLNAVHSEKSPFAIYIKVMINHLQLIFLTSSFDLSWPDQVNAFYDQTEPVANVSDKVVSLDCFLDGTTSSVIGRFYLYLLTYLLIPFLVTAASLLFWYLKIRKNKKRICSRSIATIIILLFLLHPTITNTMFQTFLCRDVDGSLRLVQELDETCWSGKHLWWALLGGFPGLICWALGIPAFAWLVLREHKKRLHNLEVKEKYGFLYKGYKVDSYYWECVIMYRKVAMIFISVFLNGIGTMIQALVVMVLLVFFIIITQRYKPYYSRQLNDLEIISLITSCITFYCGLFFLSSKSPSDVSFEANRDFYLSSEAKWVFFFVIVFANLLFLIMWIFKFLGEVREMFRKKCTGLYVCLCLCCRRGLLVEDIRSARHNAVRQIVIDTIEQLERYFRKLRHMYIRGKNFVDKQKFEKMVHTVHHEFDKLNTNQVLLDEEGEQPAYKGNIRMHAAFDDQFSRTNNALKEQVDNQEISKITFSINDKDASIFVIEDQEDIAAIKGRGEVDPIPKGAKLQTKMVKHNLDLEEPERIDGIRYSPESEQPTMSMDPIRISDRRKQLLMTESRMTIQNSSDFDERTALKVQSSKLSERSKDQSEEELKVDMNEILEESSPDEIIILSERRENNSPLEQPEEENYHNRKNSGYKKLRGHNPDQGKEIPLFDEGIFDIEAKRPRQQTQKIIKVNAEDMLRVSSEYGIEFDTNKLKKQGRIKENRQQNKIKIKVHHAKAKEAPHHKVRGSARRSSQEPDQEEGENDNVGLDSFVNELKEMEEPTPKNVRAPSMDVISEAEVSPQSTRIGFATTRNIPVMVEGFERQNTIARMEAAFENQDIKGNEF